mmetsp:Transcript_29724/g.64302  ORF Transcript_29724/g.64302 Transcript_29724/m.64302 type:complete len:303 (+) Transcript_29724:168-1076(+)
MCSILGLGWEVLAIHEFDAPKVLGKARVRDVVVGHVEVAFVSPALAPRVADDEDFPSIVVAHSEHGMTSHHLVVDLRHAHPSVRCNSAHFEGSHHSEAERDGEALVQASLEAVQVALDLSVLLGLVGQGLLVGITGGLVGEGLLVVGPGGLIADAQLRERLDAITNVGAGVLVGSPLHRPLVVVDEQTAGNEILFALLHLGEVEGAADGIGSAAAEATLVVDRKVLRRAQIHLGRQVLQLVLREGQVLVTVIRQVTLPAHTPDSSHRKGDASLLHHEGFARSACLAAISHVDGWSGKENKKG